MVATISCGTGSLQVAHSCLHLPDIIPFIITPPWVRVRVISAMGASRKTTGSSCDPSWSRLLRASREIGASIFIPEKGMVVTKIRIQKALYRQI